MMMIVDVDDDDDDGDGDGDGDDDEDREDREDRGKVRKESFLENRNSGGRRLFGVLISGPSNLSSSRKHFFL